MPKAEYAILDDQDFSYIDKCMNILIFKIEVLMEHRRILQHAQQDLFDERKVIKGIVAEVIGKEVLLDYDSISLQGMKDQ